MGPLYDEMQLRARGRHVRRRRDRRYDDEQTVFVAGRDAVVFDGDRQRNSLDEVAARDLLLDERPAAPARRLHAASGDHEAALVDVDAQRVGVRAGDLDYDDDAALILVDEDVGVGGKRPQAGANDEFHRAYNTLSRRSDSMPACYMLGSGSARPGGHRMQGARAMRSGPKASGGIRTSKNCAYFVATP